MLYQLQCGHVVESADPDTTTCPEGDGPQLVAYALPASVIDGGEDL